MMAAILASVTIHRANVKAQIALRGPDENYETKIFCSFFHAESEFEVRFLLSALEHTIKNS